MTTLSESEICVSYGQVAVFDADDPNFNLWSDDHVAQGFAWRQGCACFGVPDHDGACLVHVGAAERMPGASPGSTRAIVVPYRVVGGRIGVGSIGDEVCVRLPPGPYDVMFELEPNHIRNGREYAFLITLIFAVSNEARFAILKRDAEMTTDVVLTRDADAAR
jgi:hypothetical protein